jgi:hypothetical protein
MLTLDSDKISEHLNNALIEEQYHKYRDYFQGILKNAIYIGADEDPTNAEMRAGIPLTHTEFERKLEKLNPSIKFDDHPTNPALRYCWHLVDGKKETISPYEKGNMPEQSILFQYEEKNADPEYVAPSSLGNRRFLDRKNLPASKWNEETQRFDFEGELPGVITTRIPGREWRRGWRTVLAKVFLKGLNTPFEIEKHFAPGNSAEWAGMTGAREIVKPW